ncbi:aldo/keto reductase [Salinarchaeum sp. Harcht-Bsk1]|uniref:aldo/keto reductase n=1 Tax=Salinarchaeum sp. Harcht-Bsk1 TaxID=1333523 RepID=UPI0003424661|nr:aldo/keto reductase [Salinarchaeum sp. Harcht-Bsk1]AGN00118.1 aldo/keto reductase [Salinarchaeum sp. Harcht-Bsk1]
MEYVQAGDAEIPELGLGTWQNTGQSCAETVETALELGYRHVDTAQMYGNEAQVGEGIERSSVDRDDVFLTTKLDRGNLEADDARESFEESLEKLGTDYVDLLLIHWPHPRVPFEETLGVMDELHDEGTVRHIGVSNFTPAQLEEAMGITRAPIVTDQVLYNPYKDQSDLHAFSLESDVALTAYSPLGRGDAISDSMLAAIGERYDKSAAQVALRWLVQQENVVAIPKATSREHLEANLAIYDFELTRDEMERIATLDGGIKRRIWNRFPGLMRRIPF